MYSPIKEADFRKQIKTEPATGYLFYGDEDYMKKFALDTAVATLSPDPTLAFFNELRFDSFTYSPDALTDALMPAPMMADRKLIVLSGIDFTAMKQSEVDALCQVLEHLPEYDYNTLIINTSADRFDAGKSQKKPSATLKKLSEYIVPVLFEKNTPARLCAWVAKHFEHNGVNASSDVCAFIIERCGRDMFNLASEVDKLAFYVLAKGRNAVSREDVINVSTPVAEYDAYAFTNAIGARRRDEALEILRDMKGRRIEPVVISGSVSSTVCDMMTISIMRSEGLTPREMSEATGMNEYVISRLLRTLPDEAMCKLMLSRCAAADLEIKGSRDGYAVLERLICTI